MPTTSHHCSSSPVASSLRPEPACVEDILSELLPFLVEAPPRCDGCPLNSSAELPAASPVLPIPQAVASEHRVQVSIRGRRYETTMEVALTYCLLFFVFFHWPFSSEDEDSAAAACAGNVASAKGPQRTVGDAVVAATATQSVTETHLLTHYTRIVEPVLRVFLDRWAAPLNTNARAQAEREKTADAETEKAGDAVQLACLPPLPRPAHITYDGATRVWKFEFAARLTAAEAAAVHARHQRSSNCAALPSAAADGSAALTNDKLNSSPFLLLQNEHMGMLLVFLRRCSKVRTERRTAAAGALPPYPPLPMRWAEMNYDEQLSFVQLLRCFGVVPLIPTYTRPTAPQTTSLYIGADAVAAAARPKGESDASSLHTHTAEFIHKQQSEMREISTAAASIAVEAPEVDKKERHIDEDGSDGLVLSAKGCARCGMAEHSTTECHY
ncbi:hypothetical protein LPMP_091230 [Leishmania panamensis]|uniref:Uncharacterized protein n=1 Tax=Leishmania panamensis TaxID=5679 RepID=A0A088RJG1_LEIPA|nr:hypothetical protein LPMP_091230 [Leishmania panamensis]AIN96038.1 hypothetical protein LPMP_091230 [Leishmania panamensis]